MQKVNRVITLLLFSTSIVFIWQVAQLHTDIATFNSKTIFDIDRVRDRYMSDTEFAFKNGCHIGTDYPPEFRTAQTTFNENSPHIYCNSKYKSKEEYFLDQLPNLGRSEK